jgi:hypothetical protein
VGTLLLTRCRYPAAGPSEKDGDMERAKADAKVLRDGRDAALVTAAGFGMIGVLVALLAFFVTFAPVH